MQNSNSHALELLLTELKIPKCQNWEDFMNMVNYGGLLDVVDPDDLEEDSTNTVPFYSCIQGGIYKVNLIITVISDWTDDGESYNKISSYELGSILELIEAIPLRKLYEIAYNGVNARVDDLNKQILDLARSADDLCTKRRLFTEAIQDLPDNN